MAKVDIISMFYDFDYPIKAYLATTFAHVRFFARMNALMYSQSRTLNKLFAAVGEVADMRPNATVYSFCGWISRLFRSDRLLQLTMACKIASTSKAFATS